MGGFRPWRRGWWIQVDTKCHQMSFEFDTAARRQLVLCTAQRSLSALAVNSRVPRLKPCAQHACLRVAHALTQRGCFGGGRGQPRRKRVTLGLRRLALRRGDGTQAVSL